MTASGFVLGCGYYCYSYYYALIIVSINKILVFTAA